MKKTLLLMLTCCIVLGLNAQKTVNIQKIDSRAIIERGIQHFDKGNYDDAIALFLKIPVGDPLYESAKYELAYAQYEKQDYTGAINSLREIEDCEFKYVERAQLLLLMGDSYSELKQYDKALEIFDNGLQHYAYNFRFYFYKGLTLYAMERYEEAKSCFQKAIFLKPSNEVLHYYYGMCNIHLGYTVPGILALNFCTLAEANSRIAVQSLQELDALYKSGVDLYNKDNNITVSPEYEQKNEFYADLIAMLNTTFATLPGYHNLSKIKHPVVASNQLVFSNIKQRPNSFAIEDQLYVPIFTKIMQDKEFNTFAYYQFSGTDLNNGKVSKTAEKMGNSIKVMIESAVAHLEIAQSHGLGIENPNDTTYTYVQSDFSAWGMRNPNRTDELVEEGLWHTISSDGQLATVANFVNGKAEGPASIYKDNELEREVVMKNGLLNGPYKSYYTDPVTHQRVMTFSTTTVDGDYIGDFKAYNPSGTLYSEGTFGSNGLEGEVRYYNEQGVLLSIQNYKAGENKGLQKQFHANGQLAVELSEGEKNERTYRREFHPNGQLSLETEYLNGEAVGNIKEFYPNGAVKATGELDDQGNIAGATSVFLRNGKRNKYATSPDSPEFFYNRAGQLIYSFNQSKGKVTGVTTYNADSTVRQTYPMKGKTVTFDVYSPLNFQTSTRTINAEENYENELILYYPTGQVREKGHYKNGQLDGINIQYYPDGNVKSYTEYTDGTINGLNVSYYDNEENSVESESLYRNDTIIGPQYLYYPDGSVKGFCCRNNNGQITKVKQFHPNGDKMSDVQYQNGNPSIITSYGKSNQVIAHDTLSCGNGTRKSYYCNGNISGISTMVGGVSHGMVYMYDFQGNLRDSARHISGDVEGRYNYCNAINNVLAVGNCIVGQLNGVYKCYTPIGQLVSESYCENHQYQGLKRFYYYSGKMISEVPYLDDMREGIATYYAPDGTTVLYEILYTFDRPVSYSARQTDGKMSEFALIGSQPLTITAYYPSGKVGAVVNYDKGMLNGTSSLYYTNGQAASTVMYKNGNRDGKECSYYPNGKLSQQLECKNGLKHGTEQFYYDNGQLQFEANYWYDMLHGAVKQYDKSGKLTRESQVFYDVLENDTRY